MTEKDLLDILNNLRDDEFKDFKWSLKYEKVGNIPPIKESQLWEAERRDVVDLMVQKYELAGAVEVIKSVLKNNRNDLVRKLLNISSGAKDQERVLQRKLHTFSLPPGELHLTRSQTNSPQNPKPTDQPSICHSQSLRNPVALEVGSDLVLSSLSSAALDESEAAVLRELSEVTVQLQGATAVSPDLDRVKEILIKAKNEANLRELRVDVSFIPVPRQAAVTKVLVRYSENVNKLKEVLQDYQMNQIERLQNEVQIHISDKIRQARGAGEKLLYHKTTQDSCDSSMTTGFNRRFAGQNRNQSYNKVNLVLLGMSWPGKSASGNIILGKRQFVSRISSMLVTTECQVAETEINGICVRVIDTPDIFDDYIKSSVKNQHVTKCKQLLQSEPCVFLLVIHVSRFADGERDILKKLEKAFGSEAKEQTVILFTRGEDLQRAGKTLEDFLQDCDSDLKKIVDQCGRRCVVFENKASHQHQVTKLMLKVDEVLNK